MSGWKHGVRKYTDRQIAILKVLYDADEPLKISEIGRRIGLNNIQEGASRCHHSMKRMLKNGMIVKEEETGLYRLTDHGKERIFFG
jgi:DNA-binding IclR family transcriptional regulator